MENENMNYEDEVMDMEVVDLEPSNDSGMGTGVAMLVGAVLTLATTAAVKVGKKLMRKIKAKREAKLVSEDEFVEVTEDQIMEVTKKKK